MVFKNITFYNYLKEALVAKLNNPTLTSYSKGGLNYDYEYIFQQARQIFPSKFTDRHSSLHGSPYPELIQTEKDQLNLEFAQDLAQGFGGLNVAYPKKEELDQELVDFEKELVEDNTPIDFNEPPTSGQYMQSTNQEQEADQPGQQPSGQEESTSQGQQRQAPRTPPRRVIVQEPQKPQYGMTKEEYAKYKAEHKEERDARARELWAQRKAEREGSNEDEDEKKKRLRRPGENQAQGTNPLQQKLNNWAKNKFNNTRLGKSLQNLNNRFANTNLGKGLTKINNLLNAPSRFLNNLGSKLGNWAGTGLKNLGSQALRGASQLASQAARALTNTAARTLGNLGSQAAGTAARAGAQAAARGAMALFGAIGIPGLIIILIVGLFIWTLWFAMETDKRADSECGKPGDVRIEKMLENGKDAVAPGEDIRYQITVVFNLLCRKGLANIVVTDILPENTTYVSSSVQFFTTVSFLGGPPPPETQSGSKGVYDPTSRTVVWTLNNMQPERAATLSLVVRPDASLNDSWVVNEATAKYTTLSPVGSSATGLVPNSPTPTDWENIKASIIAAFTKHPELLEVYKQASTQTGVPWQVLAGLHFVENAGGPGPDSSLVSGRKLGVLEPDISPAKCAAGVSGLGVPVPIGGGCGFTNQVDSAIYAANHLAEKIGKVPATFEEVVMAASRYNGGGNANCGEGLPYNLCPPPSEGQDDPYAMADVDADHSSNAMYVIFCADRTKCSPPKVFGRPGVMAVVRALTEQNL